MITIETIQEMTEKIVTRFRPQRIILFGSHARGEADIYSDVDLLIITETTLPKPKRSAPIYSLLRDYPFSKDILVYSPEELEQYRHLTVTLISKALREGRVLYER